MDKMIIEYEHEQMSQGIIPSVIALDNHSEHINAHIAFFRTHNEYISTILAHIQEHHKVQWETSKVLNNEELQLVRDAMTYYIESKTSLP